MANNESLRSTLTTPEAVTLCHAKLREYHALQTLAALTAAPDKIVPINQYHQRRLSALKQVLYQRHQILNEIEHNVLCLTHEINQLKGHLREEKAQRKMLIEQKSAVVAQLLALRGDNEVNLLNVFVLEHNTNDVIRQQAIVNAILNFAPYVSLIEHNAKYYVKNYTERFDKSCVAFRHHLPESVFVAAGDLCKLMDEEAALIAWGEHLANVNMDCQQVENLLATHLYSVFDLCLLDENRHAVENTLRELRKIRTAHAGMIHNEPLAADLAAADPLLAQRIAVLLAQKNLVQVSLQQTFSRAIRVRTKLQQMASELHFKLYNRYSEDKAAFFANILKEQSAGADNICQTLMVMRTLEAIEMVHVQRREQQYEYVLRVLKHVCDAVVVNAKRLRALLTEKSAANMLQQSIAFRIYELLDERKKISANLIRNMQMTLNFHTEKDSSDLSQVLVAYGKAALPFDQAALAFTHAAQPIVNHAEIAIEQMVDVATFFQDYCTASVYYAVDVEDAQKIPAQLHSVIAHEKKLIAMLQGVLDKLQAELHAALAATAYYQRWQQAAAALIANGAVKDKMAEALGALAQCCDERATHLENHLNHVLCAHDLCEDLQARHDDLSGEMVNIA